VAVVTLARREAKKVVIAHLRAQGLKVHHFSAKDLTRLAEAELERNRAELIAEAIEVVNTSQDFDALNNRGTARRHFPPPWSIAEYNVACFIVHDHNGQALAYVYFEEETGRRSAANLLTKDEARRIAASIAKLPELLQHKPPK
jgi:hypothetical protein